MISLNTPYITKKPLENPNIKKETIEEIRNNLDQQDIILLIKLDRLRSTLGADNCNLSSIKNQINELAEFDHAQNYAYLRNLMKPERAKGSKVPSQIPLPSCAFQLHNSITVTTNASGNCAVFMNPFFLASQNALGAQSITGSNTFISDFLTTMWVNNDSSLTGNSENDNFIPVNIGQTLPNVYDQYRVVSASMVVNYIGRLDIVSGRIGGAIFFDEVNEIGGHYQTGSYSPSGTSAIIGAPDLAKYGNFDLAEDSFFHREHSTLEGIRLLYFPLDNSYEEFIKTYNGDTASFNDDNVLTSDKDGYKSGFNWFFYARGATPNTNAFKVDIYINFEALPNAAFLNYMPISINPFIISPEEKKNIIFYVQSKPISKCNDEDDPVLVPSLFTKLAKKFSGGMPCLDKLKSMGLLYSMPSLKPGFALAGTMMSQNYMDCD